VGEVLSRECALTMLKRLFDLLLASFVGFIFAPIIMLLVLLVRFKLGSPVLFEQKRPGLFGKPFYIYKFRTMNDHKNAKGELLPDAERLTSFGKWLRSTSLDELPSLWNVLKGEMSLVGPRPLLMEYLPLYNAEQARRHALKPGITGWAQVNGRNAISWYEKFKLDVWYVDNQSFYLDVKIILLTIKKVFLRDGVNAKGEATMHKFTGNNTQ
jgi:sugar transferase EpsL